MVKIVTSSFSSLDDENSEGSTNNRVDVNLLFDHSVEEVWSSSPFCLYSFVSNRTSPLSSPSSDCFTWMNFENLLSGNHFDRPAPLNGTELTRTRTILFGQRKRSTYEIHQIRNELIDVKTAQLDHRRFFEKVFDVIQNDDENFSGFLKRTNRNDWWRIFFFICRTCSR